MRINNNPEIKVNDFRVLQCMFKSIDKDMFNFIESCCRNGIEEENARCAFQFLKEELLMEVR